MVKYQLQNVKSGICKKKNETITEINETFVSEFDNKCKLKLHLSLDLVNNVFKKLNETVEYSGEILCDNQDNHIDTKINKGESDSVFTPNNIINFHTHPISCYNQGGTCWGWPSGEDIRETIKFALNGNKAHLVFTVEGLYTIQVSPCKLILMKKLTSEQRGILIFIIEEYFKTTHELRCFKDLNTLKNKKKIIITPFSFVDFTNNFKLENILKNQIIKENNNKMVIDTGHTGIYGNEDNKENYLNGTDPREQFTEIPRLGFPELDGTTIASTSLKEYFIDFDDIQKISITGGEEAQIKPKLNKTTLTAELNKLIQFFKDARCNIEWNNSNDSWFHMNLFPSSYYSLQRFYKDHKWITPPSTSQINLIREPFIKIYSKKTDGCTINEMSNKSGFKMGNTRFNFGLNTRVSTFGEDLDIRYLTSL
jgi:hypothetical protein